MIAVALLVLGFFGLERLRGSRPSVQGGSIAVLPLTNESGDANEQYFSDGISEDLITALAQFPGLKVIGRTSSFQFRDAKEGPICRARASATSCQAPGGSCCAAASAP